MSQRRHVSALLQHISEGDEQNATDLFHTLIEDRVLSLMNGDAPEEVEEDCESCDDADHAALYEAMKKAEKDDDDDEDEDENEDSEDEEKPKKKLFGKQSKLDMNKNGKLDAPDFKLLRAKKKLREFLELNERNRENAIKKKEYVIGLARQTPWEGPRPTSPRFHSSRMRPGRNELHRQQNLRVDPMHNVSRNPMLTKGEARNQLQARRYLRQTGAHRGGFAKLYNSFHPEGNLIQEGRPLRGHPYHDKPDAHLRYIMKDAHAAAKAMQGHNPSAESKYLDQVNDAATVLGWRQRQQGRPKPLKNSLDLDGNLLSEGVIKRTNKDNKRNVIAMIGAGQASVKDRHALKPNVMRKNLFVLKNNDKENVQRGRAELRKRNSPSLLQKKWERQDKFFFNKGKEVPDWHSSDRSVSAKDWRKQFMKDDVMHYLRSLLSEGEIKRTNKEKRKTYYSFKGVHSPDHPSFSRRFERKIRAGKAPHAPRTEGAPSGPRRLPRARNEMSSREFRRHIIKNSGGKSWKTEMRENVMFNLRSLLAEGKIKRRNKNKKNMFLAKLGSEETAEYPAKYLTHGHSHGNRVYVGRNELAGAPTRTRGSFKNLGKRLNNSFEIRDAINRILLEGEVKRRNKAKKAAWENKVGERHFLQRAADNRRRFAQRAASQSTRTRGPNFGRASRNQYYELLHTATSPRERDVRKQAARMERNPRQKV